MDVEVESLTVVNVDNGTDGNHCRRSMQKIRTAEAKMTKESHCCCYMPRDARGLRHSKLRTGVAS